MDSSFFSTLSGELRNLIWHQTLTTTYATTLHTNSIFHPLTLTCRQIRSETIGIFLTLTSLNAHLNDGPITPLARWLKTIGPKKCLLLRDLNIWDMHMLNGTLHGVEATQRVLKAGPADGEGYVLRPVGRQVFRRSWFLKDVILALQAIGLGLARFCVVDGGGEKVLKETSRFAIMPSTELHGLESTAALVAEFGLSDLERASLVRQLEAGKREVRLLEGRRSIVLSFDVTHRITSMRQEFIPRDEEYYLEGDSAGVITTDRIA